MYFDEILKLINKVKLPDISLREGDIILKGNTFELDQLSQDVQFINMPDQNSIYFQVANFTGKFACDSFRIKEFIFVATGSMEMELNSIDI